MNLVYLSEVVLLIDVNAVRGLEPTWRSDMCSFMLDLRARLSIETGNAIQEMIAFVFKYTRLDN